MILLAAAALLAHAGCKKPKPTGPDLSNPKAAALTFTRALEEGDVATARLASNASGIENDLLSAMAESAVGLKRLSTVAVAKFGQDASKLLQQQSMNVSKNLSTGEVEEGSDRATVRSKDGRDSLQLHKIDGQWRVDIGALIRGQNLSGIVPFFRAAGLAAKEVADEIEAGRCTSVEAARQDMASRISTHLPRFIREQYEASTRPAVEIPGL